MKSRACRIAVAALLGCLMSHAALADPPADERGLTELRNTVINLLQTLVEHGVITREQAETMVKNAQDKAAAEAAANAKQEEAERGAVRVPYVPQIVKDEIKKEVVADLTPSVKKEVVDEVSSKGSLFGALPDWVQRMTWTGDIRVRGEGDIFPKGNAPYLDFNQVNSKGGIQKAGEAALLNTSEDQDRLRLRVRFGFDTVLGAGWTTAVRVATGSTGEIVATTNQTLGAYGSGYTVTIDQGFLRWTGQSSDTAQIFTATAGRFDNPFVSTDLIWYNDLTFEGVIGKYRYNLSDDNQHRHDLFVTLGALPIESFSLFDSNPSGQQKWLTAAQIGADLTTDEESRLRLAAAYYNYIHMVGQRNPLNGTVYNWTAPSFVQKGNTLFDISNSTDPSVNLFALASNYRIIDLLALGDIRVTPAYSLGFTAEALKNVGFNSADVQSRVGYYVAPRTQGYRADVSFGTSHFDRLGAWRASAGYRYLQRDAGLDAFNDEDFHLGGTDTKGYTLLFDMAFNPHVWMRLKYMSADAIDGPAFGGGLPLNIDVWQLDFNGHF